MDTADVERLLAELRSVGMERGSVEAKRTAQALPGTTWESMSAFANTDGGTVLLGVDENGGAFDVVGVDDPGKVTQDLQAACAELEPPLRPRISVVDLEEGTVIVAEVPPLARSARPCYRRAQGPYGTAFIRVGDADQALSRAEVDEMLAARAGHDHSRRPAPEHAEIDAVAASEFCDYVRGLADRFAELDDETILRSWGVVDDGRPTLAGLLTLGDTPAGASPAARIAYRRWPPAGAPENQRFAATHLEGRVGELLDDALGRLRRDLTTVQVERNGNLYDDLDVPAVALREIIGNALLHRSLSDAQETVSVAIEVTDEAVVVTSPGGLHVSADPAILGLDAISGVRNLTLVRVSEQLQTPSGARIVENQASGIASADRESARVGTMPPLFIDLPTSFRVVMLRGVLDLGAATELLRAHGVAPTPGLQRLTAVAQRLQRANEEVAGADLRRVVLDARLAARALAPSTTEDGAAALRQLEDAGVLERRHTRHGAFWVVAAAGQAAEPRPEPRVAAGARRDRVPDVLRAIAASPDGELRSGAIGEALELTSPTSINRWITRALERELIEPTVDNPYAPTRAYRLTRGGRAIVESNG